MLQKYVYDIATDTTKLVNYERGCLIFQPTNLCTSIIDIDEGTIYTPDPYYYYIINYEGQVGWTWDGINWIKPTNVLKDAYLEGSPTTDTPDLQDEGLRVPNTFWVREKIQDYIDNVWLVNGILDGGSFSDPAPTILLNAGYFDDTGINLSDDISSPVFNNTGGNLTADITVSGY